MNFLKLLLILLLFPLMSCHINTLTEFPENFMIGVSSSAYQTEGAWNVSDKKPNIWDRFTHQHPEKIADFSNADITTDVYHKFEKDIKLLKYLGVDHYHFSISWSRILPFGHAAYISKSGINFYNKILDKLESVEIEPFVTLYYWDHPQVLEDLGGWTNEKMAHLYAEYAKVVFSVFGKRVKYFATMNSPNTFCRFGYGLGVLAPGKKHGKSGEYACVHNALKANALAHRLYNDEFRKEQQGLVGIIMQCEMPYNENEDTFEVAEEAFEFNCGWVANPIFSEQGDYPEIMKSRIAEGSKLKGVNNSELPVFSESWINDIRGSADFFGLNYFASIFMLPESKMFNWPNDEGFIRTHKPSWQASQIKIYPDGLRDLLTIIRDKYANPPVYITENGIPDENGVLDYMKIDYLYWHMKAVLLAKTIDLCDVRSYSVKSLLDSFEWASGFAIHYGLFSVDFNHENRTRTPKMSAFWLQNIIQTRNLGEPQQLK